MFSKGEEGAVERKIDEGATGREGGWGSNAICARKLSKQV